MGRRALQQNAAKPVPESEVAQNVVEMTWIVEEGTVISVREGLINCCGRVPAVDTPMVIQESSENLHSVPLAPVHTDQRAHITTGARRAFVHVFADWTRHEDDFSDPKSLVTGELDHLSSVRMADD